MTNEQNNNPSLLSTVIRKTGSFLHIALPAAAFIHLTYQQDFEGLAILFAATALTSAVTHSLKHLTNNTWLGTRPNGKPLSFPSADSSSAFSAVAFMTNYYKLEEEAVLLYSLACFTAYSRVHSSNHHVRDVLVGSLLGLIITKCCVAYGNDIIEGRT